VAIKLKNKVPKLGLFSGLRGDEQEIILAVQKVITKLNTKFIFIPYCSPSAIKLKTRLNSDGIDINRDFTQHPQSQESKNIINQLKLHHFEICVDFHEDNQLSGVYVYDSSDIEGTIVLENFREQVQKICPLYTGIDDRSDSFLGCEVHRGYYSYPPQKDSFGNYIYEGFLDIWALIEKVTDRWITLELPSKLSQNQKDRIVEIFFQTFLGKYLSK
jgi:hypothetical protein